MCHNKEYSNRVHIYKRGSTSELVTVCNGLGDGMSKHQTARRVSTSATWSTPDLGKQQWLASPSPFADVSPLIIGQQERR